MWKNNVEPGRPQLTIWSMCIACWIPKATNTHSVLCNTSCCSIATMVPHTHLNITLYIHYLSLTLFTETNFCTKKLILINSIIKYDAQQVQQTWRWLVFFVTTVCITVRCFVTKFKLVIPLSCNCDWKYFLAKSSSCTHLILLQQLST
jgi:hypothetical protein